MSALVCGKRSLFDEIHSSIPKRLRCGGGTSPVRLPFLRSGSPVGFCESGSPILSDSSDQLSQLRILFPEMDGQLIEKVLESSESNLDSAIRSLNALRLSSDVGGNTFNFTIEKRAINLKLGQEGVTTQSAILNSVNADKVIQGQSEGSEWTEWADLFVQKLLTAADLDDMKDCATRALEAFEKILLSRSGCVFQEFQKENAVLKEQIQNLICENHILKRAVTIQHERQAEHENCSQEMERLKQLIAQYQEQIRSLELNNYALKLHLHKAQEGSSIPGRFHPDVF